MANTRENASVHELAKMAIAIVDYISIMDKNELNDEIKRVNEKTSSWLLWFYNKLPAIRSYPEEQINLSAPSSLEIAANVFNSPDFQETSVNAQLLRELIRKSQGAETVSKLPNDQLATLHRFVYEKIRYNIKYPEAITNKQDISKVSTSVPEVEKLEMVKEEKAIIIVKEEKAIVIVKEDKAQKVVKNDSDVVKLLVSQSVFNQSSQNNKQTSQRKDQQNNHAPKSGKKPDFRSTGEINQPASFRR